MACSVVRLFTKPKIDDSRVSRAAYQKQFSHGTTTNDDDQNDDNDDDDDTNNQTHV